MAIKINVGILKDGDQIIDFVTDAKEIGLDENLVKNKIYVSVDVFKAAHQIDLDVKVNGTLKLTCDRCVDEFEQPFENEFELVYVQKSAGEMELNTDYIRLYTPFLRSIDLTADVRDITLLSVPMKKLPAETADGTCSWCGKTKEYWKDFIVDEDQLNK